MTTKANQEVNDLLSNIEHLISPGQRLILSEYILSLHDELDEVRYILDDLEH